MLCRFLVRFNGDGYVEKKSVTQKSVQVNDLLIKLQNEEQSTHFTLMKLSPSPVRL